MAIVNERMTLGKVQQAERLLQQQAPPQPMAVGPVRPGQPPMPQQQMIQAPVAVGPLSLPPSQSVRVSRNAKHWQRALCRIGW